MKAFIAPSKPFLLRCNTCSPPLAWLGVCRENVLHCLCASVSEICHSLAQAKQLQLLEVGPGGGGADKEKRKGKQRGNLIQTWYWIDSCGTILLPFLEGKPWELWIASSIPVCTHSWDAHARGPCYMHPDSTAHSEANKKCMCCCKRKKGDYFGIAGNRPGIRTPLQIHGRRVCNEGKLQAPEA